MRRCAAKNARPGALVRPRIGPATSGLRAGEISCVVERLTGIVIELRTVAVVPTDLLSEADKDVVVKRRRAIRLKTNVLRQAVIGECDAARRIAQSDKRAVKIEWAYFVSTQVAPFPV